MVSRRRSGSTGRLGNAQGPARLRKAIAAIRNPLATKDITPGEVMRRLSRCLSPFIGPGGSHSFAEAARLTHINERTLRAYVDGTACPNLARYGRLLRVFGPGVGIELALMLGWEPRARIPAPPSLDELITLREGVRNAMRAVEEAAARGDKTRGPQ